MEHFERDYSLTLGKECLSVALDQKIILDQNHYLGGPGMFNGNCHQHSPSCLEGPITLQILIKHSCEISPTPKSQKESNKSLIMQHEIPQLMSFGWFERYP